jgi:hypothetical protein
MRVSQSRRFEFASSIPLAKVGLPLPISLISNAFHNSCCESTQNGQSSARRFSVGDLRHNFAIKALQKPGIFRPRPYLYICVRCRYTFLVNERRGSIVALDRKGQTIPEPENSRRSATFAEGPCPAFKTAIRPYTQRETVDLRKPRRLSLSAIWGLVALIGIKMRYPYFVESNIHSPAGIVPQDMLF